MFTKKSVVSLALIMCSAFSLFTTTVKDANAAEKKQSAIEKKVTSEKKSDKEDKVSEDRDEGIYTESDMKNLAAIIYCEAGDQSYAGKVAVGCVVLNRVESNSFPDTIISVIKQRGQFSPVRQGKFSRELNNVEKGKYKKGARRKCLKAAQEVLEGQRDIVYKGKVYGMKKYHFFSMRLSNAKLRIGGHDFK